MIFINCRNEIHVDILMMNAHITFVDSDSLLVAPKRQPGVIAGASAHPWLPTEPTHVSYRVKTGDDYNNDAIKNPLRGW